MKRLLPFLAAALIAGCVSKPVPPVVPASVARPVTPASAAKITVPAALYPSNAVTTIKHTSVKSAIVIQPPPARTNILLSWDYGTNRSMTRVWFTTDLNQPMTLLTNTLATNFSASISSGTDSGFFRVSAAPESVTLEWNPSPSTNVVGYKIYWGTASGVYSNMAAFGNVTNTQIDISILGTTWYFAATALDALGVESPFSNEATWTTPANALGPQNFKLILR